MLNAALVGILGAVWFIVMYRWYGGFIDRKIIQPDNNRPTPANAQRDNVDFVPSQPALLFGHHFSSIAGAGPIVGPILAYSLFGWLPALLWIFLGSVFIGAVHDYTSLMTSVRSRGISVANLAQTHVSNVARWIFSVFLWLALVLVIAVFAVLTAQTLAEKPEIVIPTVGLIVLAMLFGFAVYRRNFNVWIGTIIGIGLMFGLIILGDLVPIRASFDFWLISALIYSFAASVIPVWFLLQPRDYLSMYILIIGLVLAFTSLLVMRPEITGPAFITASSKQGPLWPILFITVACGAISGFHSVVASGTSAKQLRRESEGRMVAFGGMLTEGALAMIVVLLISSVLFWEKAPASELSGFVFGTLLAEKGANITFGTAIGRGLESLGIPLQYGIAFGILMLNAFILTTLDTCARLTRYIVTESVGQRIPFFRNIFVATAIGLVLAYVITAGNSWRVLWPAFGAANQLIGALSLLVVSAYFFGYKRATKFTIIPAVFMLTTTLGALVYQLFWQYLPSGNIILSVIAVILIVLGVVIAVEVYRRFRRKEHAVPPEREVVLDKV
ncbi:MAG: carbon starvation protein A [Ignavibacteria bacterium]|nr:carbon starvation protein A [Ignavibacteria bacterium]